MVFEPTCTLNTQYENNWLSKINQTPTNHPPNNNGYNISRNTHVYVHVHAHVHVHIHVHLNVFRHHNLTINSYYSNIDLLQWLHKISQIMQE